MAGSQVSNITSVFKGMPFKGRNYFSNTFSVLETPSNKPTSPRLYAFNFSFTCNSLRGPNLGGVLKLGTNINIVSSFFYVGGGQL